MTEMTIGAPHPPISHSEAIFLDLDGTLLDFAMTPDAVIVPKSLPALIRRLTTMQSGALALVSGRTLSDIDSMFGRNVAVAAEHGAILRDAAGRTIQSARESGVLAEMAVPLRAAIAVCPGTMLEEKRFGLVLHWRGAPAEAAKLTALATFLAGQHDELMLQPAHEALEIRVRGPGKAAALDSFMKIPPFAGRRPVFVGDDLTDEPAIARATELGGRGLHVGRDFTGGPAAVLAWLEAGLKDKGDADA